MDETTVFQGQNLRNPTISGDREEDKLPQSSEPPSEPVVNTPLEHVAAEQPLPEAFQPPVSSPPFAAQTEEPSMDDEGSSSRFKTLIKLALGVLVVVFIAFFAFFMFSKISKGPAKVTLSYWGLWEDSRTMASLISDFERQNPNITVTYSKEDIKQYRERVVTRIKNGNGPDVFTFHNTWVPMVSDVLLPLPQDTISRKDFEKSFYPVATKDLIKNGGIYGIPLQIDTLNLYVNRDLLKSAGLNAPSTWSDFVNTAKSLTVKDESGKIKTAGAAMGTFGNITHAPDIISLLFIQNGVDLSNISGSVDRVSDSLRFYTDFAVPEGNVWDNSLDNSTLAFSKGALAMYFGYSWDFFTIKSMNQSLNFDIVPVPQLPGISATIASYWAQGVSVKSSHQKEALLFMKFLSQKDMQEKLYTEEAKTRVFGEPYSRVDLADKLKDSPYIYPFVKTAPFAASSYFVDSTYDNGLNSQMNTYLGNAVDSILKDTSPQTAAQTLSQGVSQVLKQYGE